MTVVARNVQAKKLDEIAPQTGFHKYVNGFLWVVRRFGQQDVCAVANYAQATVGTYDLILTASIGTL